MMAQPHETGAVEPKHSRWRTRLLAGTALSFIGMLSATGAAAGQEPSTENLAARVTALESKLDAILSRLDGGAALTAQEVKTVAETAQTLNAAAHATRAVTVSPVSGSPVSGSPVSGSPVSGSPVSEGPVADTPFEVAAAAGASGELQTPGGIAAQTSEAPVKEGFSMGGVDFALHGFVKIDASVTDFSGGELPSSSIGRDFFIPSLIPVGGEGDGPDFDFNPRESRFLFTMASTVGEVAVGAKLEFDFQVTDGGDERVSNSFIPRMRQAYVTAGDFLIGQTWSTFQDVTALPDSLEFIGPSSGTVFNRQPMIRYTRGPWQFAAEQPETTVTGPTGARLLPGDDPAPDLVVRYNHKRGWGHLTAAGITRFLHIEEDLMDGAVEDTAIGYGLSLSGLVKVGRKDDIRFMATAGEGLGRYIAVNAVNDAAIDLNGELDPIPTFSGFLAYRHFWSDKWRSNILGGYFQADNPVDLTGAGVTDEVFSGHVNLIYTPAPRLDVGIEYIRAERELENGADGTMNRVLMSTKYSF